LVIIVLLLIFLNDSEYSLLKTVVSAMATQSIRIDDANKMLALPGDEKGNGGGLDFGSQAVREVLDYWHATWPGIPFTEQRGQVESGV
jgi:hypothetical protein